MAKKGKYLDIDELYRSKFANFPVEPGEYVKTELMRKVSAREFTRFNPYRFNVYYLAATVVAVSAALIMLLSDKSSDNTPDEVFRQVDTVKIIDRTDTKSDLGYVKSEEESGLTDDLTELTGVGESTVKHSADVKRAITTSDRASNAGDVKLKGMQQARDISVAQKADVKGAPGVPESSFIISEMTGCMPLIVDLKSTSKNYNTLQWVISDGRTMSEESLQVEFSKPGEYTVLLMVSDEEGSEDYSQVTVTVYPLPVAGFDVETIGRSDSDREIVLYNYSDGSLTSSWDFGDGGTSVLREPLHTYEAAGEYRIVLTVTNEFGCSDTASAVHNSLAGQNSIVFPNAFIPNKNGPTGGYYSLRSDEASSVFHPVYEGVTDYHLVIYSRTGAVIFESRDLNIGWDGYYKGQLCEAGVYLWRARGRYLSGDQFHKVGDVTLLRF